LRRRSRRSYCIRPQLSLSVRWRAEHLVEREDLVTRFDEHIGAAVAAWKAKIRRVQPGPQRRSDPVAALREGVRVLEADIAAVEARLETERHRANAAETRAMNAIRATDDAAARQALLEQRRFAEACEELRADVDVLHAMLAECRSVLTQGAE
jgi:phage shock protein A